MFYIRFCPRSDNPDYTLDKAETYDDAVYLVGEYKLLMQSANGYVCIANKPTQEWINLHAERKRQREESC